MPGLELVLVLLLIVTALIPLAGRFRVPYPVVLVLAGLVLALLPIFPDVPVEPDLVLLLFLPPLLYSAAYSTSVRDLRRLLRPIILLAVVLVLLTTVVSAALLHTLLPGLGWPASFAFGAIISPPDAVAAVAVFRQLGVPRRIVALLEGESLFNDATALVTYRAAVGAMAVSFSLGQTAISFPVVGLGGVLIGLLVGVIVGWLRRLLNDPPVEIALSLLTPFGAYLPAEHLGLSGVLATVTAGLYLGWRDPYISRSAARLSGRAVWNMVDFVMNGLVFILIGLQLSVILRGLEGRSILSLIGTGLVLSFAAIGVRMAWVFLEEYVRWWLTKWQPFRRIRGSSGLDGIGGIDNIRRIGTEANSALPAPSAPSATPTRLAIMEGSEGSEDLSTSGASDTPDKGSERDAPPWREMLVVGWAGMRGVVSLATALALPEQTPDRDLLIFVAFTVILVTLVGQGLTLPLLIRVLGVGVDETVVAQQGQFARRRAVEAALSRLEELSGEWPAHLPLIDALRAQYGHRASHLEPEPANRAKRDSGGDESQEGATAEEREDPEQEMLEHHLIRRAVIDAERSTVLDLRERGMVSDEIWREIERELDLEELRMDA
ncbi:MAG: sodium:proton antiporter [Chloroflexi bacterium]|nr:sodium:proton antiporter [Chloroflexota bacterium]